MSFDDLRVRRDRVQHALSSIEEFSKPCIAVVHGAAVAGGVEIALRCDFIYAGEAATFRYPVAVRGSLGDTLRLPGVVGKQVAKELLFSGRLVKADEALTLGLVNRVVPTEQLLDEARALAAAIAENDPEGMKLTKHSVDTGSTTATTEDILKMEQGAINAATAFQSERSGGDRTQK
jgi:enoyl-CoA hydratase